MARRIKEDPQVHKDRIAGQAQVLFSQRGIENTSMDAIAGQAGYSKATLYVYFKNKDEIVKYLALKSMEGLRSAIVTAAQTKASPREQFLAICFSLVRYQEQYPEYFSLALARIHFKSGDEVHNTGDDINRFIADIMKAQGKDFSVADIFHLWAMVSGVITMAVQKKEYIEDDIGMSVEEFLREGFLKIYNVI